MTGENLDGIINRAEKVFDQMGCSSLVCGVSKLELPPKLCQLKEYRFGFVAHISSEVWDSRIFERLTFPPPQRLP